MTRDEAKMVYNNAVSRWANEQSPENRAAMDAADAAYVQIVRAENAKLPPLFSQPPPRGLDPQPETPSWLEEGDDEIHDPRRGEFSRRRGEW